MSAEMEAAAAKVAAVERQLHFATATVALEELESVTATAREAMSKMADARTKGKLFAHILANPRPTHSLPASRSSRLPLRKRRAR